MAQFDLYVDTYSGDVVVSDKSTSLGQLPKFVQGDTPSFRVYLLARTTTFPTSSPYSIINNATLTMKMALGPKDGTAGSTLYTQQFTWTRDANNQYFSGTLPLNTAGITTRLGSAESNTAWFEIEITEAGFPTTVLQKSVTIDAEVIETGSITVPAGQTAMSAEEANAIFLKRTIYGAVNIINETTGKGFVLYADADGNPHMDVIP